MLQGGALDPEQPGCFLALRCAPDAAEELVAVGVLSSARNMEVYLGHDYCGTGRGRAVGAAPGLRCVRGAEPVRDFTAGSGERC